MLLSCLIPSIVPGVFCSSSFLIFPSSRLTIVILYLWPCVRQTQTGQREQTMCATSAQSGCIKCHFISVPIITDYAAVFISLSRAVRSRDAKFRPGGPAGLFVELGLRAPGSCRARGKRSQCIVHWPPGFVRCLEDAGWARCWSQQISCGAGLDSGLAFGEIFASLVRSHEFLAGFSHTH